MMIKKTAFVVAAVLLAGSGSSALAQSYGPLHPGKPPGINRAPHVYKGPVIYRRGRDAFARVPDSRYFAAPYAAGRNRVIGKDHGLNGW
jgi:hypothetical protein